MDESTRRRFLRMSGIAGTIGFTGCTSLVNSNTPTPANKDSDGDGVIDSEDYAPRDASVQRAEQVQEAGSRATTTERQTPTDTATETETATEESIQTTVEENTTSSTAQVVFQDEFDDGVIGSGWEVPVGSYTERNGYITADTYHQIDDLYHDEENRYNVLEYEFKHGGGTDNQTSVLVAFENEVDWRGNIHEGGVTENHLQVLHNDDHSESWRAALRYVQEGATFGEDDDQEGFPDEVLATWGSPSNINDGWHTYRVERSEDTLRFLVDGTLAGTSSPRLPMSSWTGKSGLHQYNNTYRVRRWTQMNI